MTARAVEELKKADLIACEDTRTSLPLLRHFGISRPLAAYHSFNEKAKAEELLSRLAGGATVALISDAGTPGISDPGFEIVRQCIAAGAEVTVLPGATAFVPALILSGLPPYPFLFYGFLPDKKGEREKAILSVASLPWTLIFYLSPHKAEKHLVHMRELLGDRSAALVREISKIYEEARRGTLSFLAESVREGVKGELVLVVEGAPSSVSAPETWRETARELIEKGNSPREVVKILSGEYGLSKNEVKAFLFGEGK